MRAYSCRPTSDTLLWLVMLREISEHVVLMTAPDET